MSRAAPLFEVLVTRTITTRNTVKLNQATVLQMMRRSGLCVPKGARVYLVVDGQINDSDTILVEWIDEKVEDSREPA